eukprot:9494851-Pyramimonas_sp.AAC.1
MPWRQRALARSRRSLEKNAWAKTALDEEGDRRRPKRGGGLRARRGAVRGPKKGAVQDRLTFIRTHDLLNYWST